MRNKQIVDSLRELAESCQEAERQCGSRQMRARLRRHMNIVLTAADTIVQLQSRLARQARYYEHLEARQDAGWPLLEDDDPGAAL